MTERNREKEAEEARRNQQEAERQRRKDKGLPEETDIERQERESREERESKAMSGAPANKDAKGLRSGKSGEEGESEITGHVSTMEEEMLANAKRKKAPADTPPPPRTIHVMEAQMKGEAVQEYIEANPHVDAGLPEPEEPPLPGKPPEPPLGGSRSGLGEPDRRNPGKRR